MENEVKVETKKKGNGLFTLFACVMTGVIVFLGTNLGQKIADNNDKGGSTKKSNVTSNVESNTTSNVASNVTSNVVSNVTSNVASNVVSNVTSNTTSNVSNVQVSVDDSYSYYIEEGEKNTYGHLFIIVNGSLYAEKIDGSFSIMTSTSSNRKKIADGVKRIKMFNTSGGDFFELFIMNDGRVMSESGFMDEKSWSLDKLKIVEADTFKGLNVDDIIEYRTSLPNHPYVEYIVKLADGTTKSVIVK